jgi:protein-disulfide isomerase
MSEKNREAKRTARERMRVEREAERCRAQRRKKITVLCSAVAAMALAVGVGITVQNQRSKPETPMAAPSGAAGPKKLVIPVGPADAPSTLTVYEDLRCPACRLFENQFHATVNRLMDQGKIVGNYHVASFIDRHDLGSGSKNAANALGCAQDAGKFRAYHDVLYANQPSESDDVWRDRGKLLALAGKVPGLAGPAFESCVNSNRYAGWVSSVQQDFDKSGYGSTPTVLLNGAPVFPKRGQETITPANLVKWVDAANKGKPMGAGTAAGLPGGAGKPGDRSAVPGTAR